MNYLVTKQGLKKSFYHLVTFLVIFLSAELGHYLFFELGTAPAKIWFPSGIMLAIFFLGGYQYAVAAFLGLSLALLPSPTAQLLPFLITSPAGQVLSAVVGAYLLRRCKFDATFSSVKEVVRFLSIIFVVFMIAPTITTNLPLLTGNTNTYAFFSWGHTWAAYTFSCLIVTPLILTWVNVAKNRFTPGSIESIFGGIFLMLSSYFLFWTPILSSFEFLFFTTFFIVLFWISLRFPTRLVVLSVAVSTFIGILGHFVAPIPDIVLSAQLLTTQLFLLLVVPILYVFSAVVKERAHTLAQLQVALRKIERESIVKSNFISLLAHELRNPLAPVKTTLEILEHQKLDADTTKLIKEAHLQVHAMQRLLDDLLDITRVTQGKFSLQIQRSHLNSMIAHAVTVSKSIFNKAHTYSIQIETDDDLWLNIDAVRFEQALVNILNNAAKYTDAGGTIEVLSRKEGDLLIISVRDNGKGIAWEHLKDVFQPFRQVEEKLTQSSGGIGIGLSITKHIIELHGGTIRAESEGLGKGSSFIIALPFTPNKTVEIPATTSQIEIVYPTRILVIEDNQAAADALSKLLTYKGHTVQVGYKGGVAAELCQSFKPQLILLDIGLTDMSGYDVAKKLRVTGYTGKIVALSGFGQLEDKQAAQVAGCDHHFTKPMAIARLEEYLISIQGQNQKLWSGG
jgi:signal transduction histidine kinase/CheY-like chemotaxis protein